MTAILHLWHLPLNKTQTITLQWESKSLRSNPIILDQVLKVRNKVSNYHHTAPIKLDLATWMSTHMFHKITPYKLITNQGLMLQETHRITWSHCRSSLSNLSNKRLYFKRFRITNKICGLITLMLLRIIKIWIIWGQ